MEEVIRLAWAYCRWVKPAKQLEYSKNISSPKAFVEFWKDSSRILGVNPGIGKTPPGWSPENHLERINKDLLRMTRDGISWVAIDYPEYPKPLAAIHDPPLVIFYRGKLPEAHECCVGLVGTRKPLAETKYAAFEFGKGSADLGIHLISGLAFGIDAAGHTGLVWAQGRGTAVLGSGVGCVTPKANRYLASKLLQYGGSLISEYPPYSQGEKYQFVQRNRIISGLSNCVVVVDAPPGSGALHTLDFALSQGRDVYVHRVGLGKGERSSVLDRHVVDGAPIIDVPEELVPCYRRNLDSLTI
jgi:DNA processing protein